MNKKDELLNELQNHRKELLKIFDEPATAGYKNIVQDLYAENAHFVFELIQNAEDAGATSVTFILTDKGVFFLHNGARDFTVTSASNEKLDTKNGTLGDLNSILSVGNSNKKFEGNKIGKFGCGFKSVFCYTDTPVLINKDLKIKIIDHIYFERCPESEVNEYNTSILSEAQKASVNLNLEKDGSTIIYLPFNKVNSVNNINNFYADVGNRLQGLTAPLLFMENISDIKIIINGSCQRYHKEESPVPINSDIELHKIVHYDPDNVFYFWKFSRSDNELKKYSVLFKSSENWNTLQFIKDDSKFSNIYCYFATNVPYSGYIIHGSFQLTPSREQIKEIPRNETLKAHLEQLAVDSIPVLRQQNAYQDEIIDFIERFASKQNQLDSFLNYAETEELLPCGLGGYSKLKNARFFNTSLQSVFSQSDIRKLFEDGAINLIFKTISSQQYKEKLKGISEFKDIIITNDKIAHQISSDFMEYKLNSDALFFEKLYDWLNQNKTQQETFFKAPIFYTDRERWLPKDNKTKIFINGFSEYDYESINIKLLEISENVRRILKEWFDEFCWKDEIHFLIKKVEIDSLDPDLFLLKLMNLLNNNDGNTIPSEIKQISFIKSKDGTYRKPDEILYTDDELWLSVCVPRILIDKAYYVQLLEKHHIDIELFNIFISKITSGSSTKAKLNCFIDGVIQCFIDKQLSEDDLFAKLFTLISSDIKFEDDDKKRLKQKFKDVSFIRTKGNSYQKPSSNIVYIDDDFWYEIYPPCYIVDMDYYVNSGFLCKNEVENNLILLCSMIIGSKNFIIGEHSLYEVTDLCKFYKEFNPGNVTFSWSSYESFYEFSIDKIWGCIVKIIKNANDFETRKINSLHIWKILKHLVVTLGSNINKTIYSKFSFGRLSGQYNIKMRSILSMMPIFIDKKGEVLTRKNNDNFSLSDLNDIYDVNDLSTKQIIDLAQFLYLNPDIEQNSIENKLNKLGISSQKFESFLDVFQKEPQILDILSDEAKLNQIIQLLNSPQLLVSIVSGNENSVAKNLNVVSDEEPLDNSEQIPLFSSDKLETSLDANYSDQSELSKEDRTAYNDIAKKYGKEYLEQNGYTFSHDDDAMSYNLLDNVQKEGKIYTVCFKSSHNNKLKLYSHEISALNKSKENFIILLYHNGRIKEITFDNLFREHESFSITLKTKDYNDANIEKFVQSLQFLGGTSLDFDVNGINNDLCDCSETSDFYDSDYTNPGEDDLSEL